MLSGAFISRERGGGGWYFGCTIDGDHQMGSKNIKTQKIPRASDKTPKTFLDHSLAPSPRKFHAEFLNLDGMQYTAKSKKVALVTFYWLNWTLSIWAYGTMQRLT